MAGSRAPLGPWAALGLWSACGPPVERRVEDCTPSAEERAQSHPRSAALSEQLARAVRGGLPGALMAVDEDGSWFYGAAGVPDLGEPERPFEVCHLMPIKSVTKAFVAVRVLQLVEAGRLDLDAPLHDLLPASVLDGLPNTDVVTVRHLLNHTSGIRHFPEVIGFITDFLNEPSDVHSSAEALDAVRGLDPYFEPGAGYHYSNTNYLLLQLVIERLTGQRLEDELRRAIWEPLGLERTHLHQEHPLSDHVPRGYMDLYGNGDAHQMDYLDVVANGEGGMESTLGDLVRFSRGLFVERTLLGPEALEEMTAMVDVDGAEWGYDGAGLGLMRWPTPVGDVLGKTGEDTGYKAYWHYEPARRLTWVLLLNSNYGLFEERAEALRRSTLELLAEP
jgi:D-alanyl-D-alanine carboxypeptidase